MANCSVLVRGFDFGTSDQQIATHMSGVGTIVGVKPIDQGTVRITYTSEEEATAAMQLQQTRIDGNSRYIDVLTLDPMAFMVQSNIESDKVNQFMAMTLEQQQYVMERGSLSTARDPNAVLVARMQKAKQQTNQGWGSSGGSFSDPYGGGGGILDGGCSVLVRGFDFNTTVEQIGGHMMSVGTVQNIEWIDSGSVRVTFTNAEEAKAAVHLQQTCIAGNSRYIDVMLLDPTEFLAPHNIDVEKVRQFSALAPDQQLAVMAKGSLSTARDPNAVLVHRMNQVKNGGGGKGSFGPAKGGMKGNGPYGMMGNDPGNMMKQMEMMMCEMMKMMAQSSGSQS